MQVCMGITGRNNFPSPLLGRPCLERTDDGYGEYDVQSLVTDVRPDTSSFPLVDLTLIDF